MKGEAYDIPNEVLLMKNKIIFLDIDGVLNEYYPNNIQNMTYGEKDRLLRKRDARNYIYDSLKEHGDLPMVQHLDSSRVEVLNKIIKYTDAKIVFSTSWRGLGLEKLTLLLTLVGFLYPSSCIGVTPHCGNRGEEIKAYLKDLVDYKYAIIDDETFDIHKHHDKENIFKVRGLTYKDAIDIIEHLK